MIEIVRVGGVPKNLNTGAFNNSGFELRTSYRVNSRLKADMNYSYLNTSVPVLAAPAHQFFSALYYTPGRFSFNASLQHIGDMYINTSTMAKENYTVVNLRASVKLGFISSKSTLFVQCDNVTGAEYSINEGFPMPGALFTGGFDLIF
jgi:iron complex outermembrane receptor protein